MPFGFPAYTEETVRFRGATQNELAHAVFDALDDLGWRPVKDGGDRVRASVPNAFHGIFMTWGAKFLVEIEDEELFLRSEGSIPIAWVDLGQHSHNIRKFLDRLGEFLDDEHSG